MIKKHWVAFLIIITICFVGCSRSNDSDVPRYFEHKILFSGETYANIAGWYTGSADNWKLIQQANPTIKPNKLKIGTTILIPENLLKTTEVMPKKFLKSNKAIPSKSSLTQSKATVKSSAQKEPTTESPQPEVKAKEEPQSIETQAPGALDTSSETLILQPSSAVTNSPPASTSVTEVEAVKLEPTIEPNQQLSPKDRAKEDLIDEILKN